MLSTGMAQVIASQRRIEDLEKENLALKAQVKEARTIVLLLKNDELDDAEKLVWIEGIIEDWNADEYKDDTF